MRKSKIIKHFRHMPELAQKEEFMRLNGIKFSYDSYYNMTVWADDGILQLFPIVK